MIVIEKLKKEFTDGETSKTILDSVSVQVAKGESIAITGESGSGKSTLLNILASLEKPDQGSAIVGSTDITSMSEKQADTYRRKNLGIIFQQYNLIDCLTVLDNVSLPARLNHRLDMALINTLLAELGIAELSAKKPTVLSGGEQQRTAIARALAHQPELVLADEPTGNLDDKNSERVAQLLFNVCRQHQTSLIIVTHSHALASKADRHFHLENGQLTEVSCLKA